MASERRTALGRRVTIRILLVDDQAMIRTGFRMMLDTAADLTVIAEASNGQQAVDVAVRLKPDVVLMDVRMPVMDGIEATRRIVEQLDSRVLILTTFDLDEYAYEGLRAGASGFLLKDALPEALYDAIRAVASGDAVLTPRITRDLVNRFADALPSRAESAPASATIDSLTPREQGVFRLIAAGMSNAEMAAEMFVAEATVKTHITRILAKLGLRDRVQVVIFAYEHGLR
jgi:DNA-binding NarL/FixJ family response regulator